MAAGPNDLTTLANVKSWLNVSTTTDDTLLQRLLSAASGYIQAWCNRVFAEASYTDTFNGKDKTKQMLGNYPVLSVTSVTVDANVIPPSTAVTVPGFVNDIYSVMLRDYWFCRGIQNVVISYTAGYATIPLEVEQACIELVALRYRERQHIGEVSKTAGGAETVSYSQKDMSDGIKTILGNYKKVVPL